PLGRAEPFQVVGGAEMAISEGSSRCREPRLPGPADLAPKVHQVLDEPADVGGVVELGPAGSNCRPVDDWHLADPVAIGNGHGYKGRLDAVAVNRDPGHVEV